MKVFNTVLSILLIIAVAFLFWKVYETPAEPEKPSASAEVEQRLKDGGFRAAHIAYVNPDSLTKNYEYHKKLSAELQEKVKRVEADLASRSKVLEENFSILQQRAESMNQQELQEAQMDLERTRQTLIRYRDEKTNQLALQEQELYKKMKDDMDTVLNKIKQEYQLDYILSYDPTSIMLSANEEFDITPLVVERLNRKHRQQKEEASTKQP